MSFDRREVLSAAEEARRTGRVRKAIAGYERILAINPDDASIHERVAPLLARRKRFAAARTSFVMAAAEQERRGFLDRALALYLSAVRFLPREAPLWLAISELHLQRHRRGDAVVALFEGSQKLRRRRDHEEALSLLRRALEIDPNAVEVTLAFAKRLCKVGRRKEACDALSALAARTTKQRRRVLGALFRLQPTARNLWRWLFSRVDR